VIINTIVVMDLWNLLSEFRVENERGVRNWGRVQLGPLPWAVFISCPNFMKFKQEIPKEILDSTLVASII
jgi:hypothetical protein